MVNDRPTPPLRPQPPLRPRRRPPPWPMVIGVGLLGLLAAVMAIILFTGGGGTASASTTPTLSPTGSASVTPSETAPATASASPSGDASPSSTPPPLALTPDSIVATTVDQLSVRSSPSTSATLLGTLEAGALSFVAGGPTDAGGYRWYLVSGLGLPPSTGCAGPIETDPYNCPIWFGWVAAASQSGVPWVAQADADCPPDAPTASELILGVTDLVRLSCYGSDPFTFRAWWPGPGEDLPECTAIGEPSGWLFCQNANDKMVTIDEEQEFGGIGAAISIDPASGVSMPGPDTWVELTVHLDDPAAQGCDEAALAHEGEDPADQYVLDCRAEMVVESVTAVDGP